VDSNVVVLACNKHSIQAAARSMTAPTLPHSTKVVTLVECSVVIVMACNKHSIQTAAHCTTAITLAQSTKVMAYHQVDAFTIDKVYGRQGLQ
jgi:hypothetical protein